MTPEQAESAVYAAVEAVKGSTEGATLGASLTEELGFESIDVVDIFFEIEQGTGTVVELNRLMGQPGKAGRRFTDITLQDLVDYLVAATSG